MTRPHALASSLTELALDHMSGRNRRMALDVAAHMRTTPRPTVADALIWQIDVIRLARRHPDDLWMRCELDVLNAAITALIEDITPSKAVA